ncbi:MAG: phosphoglycerate kinase [Acidobacteriota bacterium]
MSRRKLSDLVPRGKRVFCRVDFNVPMQDGQITDDRRIRAAVPTLEFLLSQGARVSVASHFGRPKGKPVAEMSLRPCAERLAQILGRPVSFATDCIGPAAAQAVDALRDGEICVLENLRFHKAEEAGDRDFAQALAANADLYVNDAFGAAHRAHASISELPSLLGGGTPGLLMEKELSALGHLLSSPARPYVAILGGAKVSDKIQLIEKLLERVDTILIGGAMAYTFLSARGVATGASLVESDKLDLARELELKARAKGVSVLLPVDHITAASLTGHQPIDLRVTAGEAIDAGRIGLDIGPRSLVLWRQALNADVKTVLWNGPVGLFEAPGCDAGTRELAAHLSTSKAFRVLGGGDTAAAAAQFGYDNSYDHVSTGGGASLEFLSGDRLPGVDALESQR